jgi:hypothetical protein
VDRTVEISDKILIEESLDWNLEIEGGLKLIENSF